MLLSWGGQGSWVMTYISPVLVGIISAAAAGYWFWRHHSKSGMTWSAQEVTVHSVLGDVAVRPNHEVVRIAHQAWTELMTRKVALRFDEKHDVIADVYESWYAVFGELRLLAKSVPAEQIRTSKDAQQLVRVLVDVLNYGLRPHLTHWQAQFLRWYNEAAKDRPLATPQEVQVDFPEYEALLEDLKRVNQQMVALADSLSELAHGRKQGGEM